MIEAKHSDYIREEHEALIAKNKELTITPPEITETQPPQEPQIFLNGMDAYADAILKFRKQIADAVQKGIMSQQTGAKIILEQEYGFFQQIVTIDYK